jgi:hypothetical protein
MSSINPVLPSRRCRALYRAMFFGLVLLGHTSIWAQSSASLGPSITPSSVRTAASCDTSWSAPRALLTQDGLRIYVEGASTVATSRGVMLVGSPTVGWMRRENFIDTLIPVRQIDPRDSPGVRLDAKGAAIPLPRLKFTRKPYSMLAVNDRGSPQLIWATTSDTSSSFGNLDSLWTSTLRAGAWTPPRSIVQGQRIRWFPNFVTLTDVHGAPLTVIPMQDTTKSPQGGLLLLQKQGNAWRRQWIGTSSFPPMGSSVASTVGDSVVVVFTGDRLVGSDTSSNALFVARLSRDDSSGSVRVLRRLGVRAAVEPKLFRIGKSLHLMWIERENGRPGGRELYESISSDEGASWSEPVLTRLTTEYRGLSVVVTSSGAAYAALLNDLEHQVIVLSRRPRGWSIARTFAGQAFTAPTLSVGNDTLRLVFGSAAPSPELQQDAPFSMIAERPLRCSVR